MCNNHEMFPCSATDRSELCLHRAAAPVWMKSEGSLVKQAARTCPSAQRRPGSRTTHTHTHTNVFLRVKNC